jgi:hypothetical protein
MNDPIPISKEPRWTVEEEMKLRKQKHDQKMGVVVLVIFGIAALSLVVPLGVFLTRIALGGG